MAQTSRPAFHIDGSSLLVFGLSITSVKPSKRFLGLFIQINYSNLSLVGQIISRNSEGRSTRLHIVVYCDQELRARVHNISQTDLATQLFFHATFHSTGVGAAWSQEDLARSVWPGSKPNQNE